MSFLQRLLGKTAPAKRIHICVECGMPVAQHKDWCSILRTQREYELRKTAMPVLKPDTTT